VDPQALARLLGVNLPDQVSNAAKSSAVKTSAVKTSAVAVDVELLVEFNIDDHPKVKAALQQVTTDRSVDTMRVVGACHGSGLTRAHARHAINTRPDLAARLAERHDDDVAECWRKLVEDAEKAKIADSAGWLSDANISELLVNRVLRGKYCWAKGLGWMRF
jgi:putative DNA primase/helicase